MSSSYPYLSLSDFELLEEASDGQAYKAILKWELDKAIDPISPYYPSNWNAVATNIENLMI